MKMSNNPALYEVLIKQYLRSIQDINEFSEEMQKKVIVFYCMKVSGIASGNKLIKTIRYPHM